MMNVRRKFNQRLNSKQDKLPVLPGVLGDGAGNVTAGSGQVYVRVAGQVEQAVCESVPHINDLRVWVGYTPQQPDVLRVLSQRVIGTAADIQEGVSKHAASHEWLGAGPQGGKDVLKVHLQQFLPLRVMPYSGLTVMVYPGLVWTGSAWVLVADVNDYGKPVPQTIDLVPYGYPASGNAFFVLMTVDSSGSVVATKGSEVTIANLGLDDIPAAPAGMKYILGAVRRYDGQSEVLENRETTDIVDLRFPMMHVHGAEGLDLDLNDLGDVAITDPADGEVLGRASGEWVNRTLAEAGIAAAADLTAHTGNTSNPHSVTKAQVGLGSVANILDKLDATTAPTVNDDSGDGYAVGSHWFDVAADKTYLCLDATVGAAVWKEVGAASALTVEEIDGLPSVANTSKIKVTNGTLTDEGGGVARLDFGSAATDGAAIHDNEAGEIALITEKITPVSTDLLLIEDSAAANAKKKVQIGNLPGGGGATDVLMVQVFS